MKNSYTLKDDINVIFWLDIYIIIMKEDFMQSKQCSLR